MTINTTQSRITYAGDNVITLFPIPFEFFLNSDITAVKTAVGGGVVTLVQNVDYTLSGAGVVSGGSATKTTALLTGETLALFLNPPITQGSHYTSNGPFPSSTLENDVDRQTQISQRLSDLISRALHAPDGDPASGTAGFTLPSAIARANTYLSFDANGNPGVATSLPGGTLSAAAIGALVGPQTPAEANAGVTPTFTYFAEGDIRRYGATTAANDNSTFINTAQLVSKTGGAATYLPPGTWKITSTITPAGNSSMYGAGGASVLAPQGCDAITFGIGTFYTTTGGFSRFFRDFQIIGNNAVNSPNSAIVANFTAASTNRVAGVQFSNLFIANFNKGFNLRGLWNSSIINCFGYNNYYGIFFIGQNIRTVILGGGWVRGTITGAGGAWGVSWQQAAGESTQSTQMVGAYTFGYDLGINCILALETQIDNCDISSNQVTGVNVTSTTGGFWLTNSWVETQNSALTTGVAVNAIGAANYQDIHIVGNHIICDNPFAGSQGVTCAAAQIAVIVNDNFIGGFDQGITNTASTNFTCKWNRVNCLSSVYSATSYAIFLNSNSVDNEIGPNYIEPGNLATLPSFFQAATMANASANIGVTASASFPVGTPVQVDATQNGFIAGVTYFVLTSAANVLTLAPTAGGTALVATGAVAVNILAAPLPLTFNSGTPAGLTFFGRGSFISTVSGYAAPLLAQMNWVASGKLYSIAITATITGTSTVATFGATGLPTFLNPVTAKQILANVTDSGVATYGMLGLATNGAMTFSKTPAGGGGFTASGAKAINVQDMVYSP